MYFQLNGFCQVCVVIFFWISGIMECTCVHLKMEFCSCARGRQWCGIIHYFCWTASIKPRLLFSRAVYASWGLFLSSVFFCTGHLFMLTFKHELVCFVGNIYYLNISLTYKVIHPDRRSCQLVKKHLFYPTTHCFIHDLEEHGEQVLCLAVIVCIINEK